MDNDGSLVFDTQLDTQGFTKGSDKLLSAATKLTNAVENIGNRMIASFNKAMPILSDIASKVSGVASGATGAATQTGAAGRSMGSTFDKLRDKADALYQSAQNGFSNGSAVLSYSDKLDGLKAQYEALRQSVAEYGQQRIPTAEYQEVSNQVDSLQKKLLQTQERLQSVKEGSAAWTRLSEDVATYQRALAEAKAEMADMESRGAAFTLGADTSEYAQMQTQLQGIAAALERNSSLIANEELEQAKLNVLAAQEMVATAKTTQERQIALEVLRECQQEYRNIAQGMSLQTDPQPEEEEKTRLQQLGEYAEKALHGVGRLGSGFLKLGGNIAKVTFKGLIAGSKAAVRGIKGVISGLGNLFRRQAQSTLSANGLVKALTSLKRMMLTRIKRTFISKVFNEMKEALTALQSFSPTFKSVMDGFNGAFKGLAGNLASVAGSILTALLPAITAIIGAVSQAISYVSALFAMLGGKTTVTVAKQTSNYAKSLGGAASKAKELNEQVHGFDELNKESSKSDSSGGGGGGAGSGAGMFEEQAIEDMLPDSVKDFFERIKKAFQEGDWRGIGSIIASGLDIAISSVDEWILGTLAPKAQEYAAIAAEFLNGLLDLDWENLGKTLADGLNTIYLALNTFFETFEWDRFGQALGSGINGIFLNLDFEGIFTFFANKINALSEVILNAATTIKWAEIAKKLTAGLNKAIKKVDAKKAGKALGEAVKGILKFIVTTIETTDWKEIGRKVGEFLRGIDWDGVIHLIFEGIGAALGGLAAFMWGLIEDAWNDVVQWWNENAFEDGKFTIQGLWDGICNALSNITDWIRDNIVVPFIEGFRRAFGISSPAKEMEEPGGYVADGILEGIAAPFKKIGQWIDEHIVQPIKNWFKSNPLKFDTSAFDTFKQTWDKIETKTATLTAEIKDKVGSLREKIAGAWDKIKAKGEELTANIKDKAGSLRTKMTDAWDKIKAKGETLTAEIKDKAGTLREKMLSAWDKLTSKDETLSAKIQDAVGSIRTTLTGAWDKLSNKYPTLTATIQDAAGSIRSTMVSAWNTITGKNPTLTAKIADASGTIRTAAVDAWNKIKTDTATLTAKVVDSTSKVRKTIEDAWGDIKTKTATITANFVANASFKSKWNSIANKWNASKILSALGKLPVLAKGGIVKNATNFGNFIAGEAGTEAVLPLERNLGWMDVFAERVVRYVERNLHFSGLAGPIAQGLKEGLDGVENIFDGITNAITKVGNFTVPSVVQGALVPAQVRISDSEIAVAGFEDFRQDFDDYMIENNRKLTQILEYVQRLKLKIDAKALSDSVSDEQQANIRAYGR